MLDKPYIEYNFTYKNYTCVVVRQVFGHLCGYVSVPYWHKAYECDYELLEDDIECHGGLTYSSHNLMGIEYLSWWIGFDCAHGDDTPEECNVQFCVKECKNIVDQLEEME